MSKKEKKIPFSQAAEFLKQFWATEGTAACSCIDVCSCFPGLEKSQAKSVADHLVFYKKSIASGEAFAGDILKEFFCRETVIKIRRLIRRLFGITPEKCRTRFDTGRGREKKFYNPNLCKKQPCTVYVPDEKGNLVVA